MNTLEQEIIDKFHQLDETAQLRVLASLVAEPDSTKITLKEWLERATAYRARLTAKYGSEHFFGVQTMLDEIREDAPWPRW